MVTEVLETESVELVAEYADILQIGARNIQNFTLLRRVGEMGKPVLLKRGMATTIQEFLLSAEYILAAGNPNVILCERGIRTFETTTRFTLDLNAVPVLKKLSHLPVVVDPSHGTGHWDLVAPMAKARGRVRGGRAHHRGASRSPRRRCPTARSRSSPRSSPSSCASSPGGRGGGTKPVAAAGTSSARSSL